MLASFLFIYLFFSHEPNGKRVESKSLCADTCNCVLSALRLSKIRRALLMACQERSVKSQNWPDLYYRRIIRLGRAWEMNGSSSDNQSVYKHGQADGSSIQTSYRNSSSFQTNYRG